MACHALGRCRICAQKHKIPVFGGEETQHCLIERANLKLIILNTVCIACIAKIERYVKNLDFNFDDVTNKDEFDVKPDFRIPCHQATENLLHINMDGSQHRSSMDSKTEHEKMYSQLEIEDAKCNCGVCYMCSGSLPLLADVVQIKSSNTLPTPSGQKTSATLDPPRDREAYRENFQEYQRTEETVSPSLQVPEERVPPAHQSAINPSKPQLVELTQKDRTSHGCAGPKSTEPSRLDYGLNGCPRTGKKVPRHLFCDFCEKKFTHAGDLSKHRRKHTGERPHECSQCQRKFAHISNLVRHQRIHTGERPFSCSRCDRTFTRRDKLTNHTAEERCNNR